MPKVTLEFKDEEKRDAELAFRAGDLMYALNQLANLRRDVYKCRFYGDEVRNIKGDTVITDEMWKKMTEDFVRKQEAGENPTYPSGGEQFIKNQVILDRLDDVLDIVRDLLD